VFAATDETGDDLGGTALTSLMCVVCRVVDKSLDVMLQTLQHCVVVVLEQRLVTPTMFQAGHFKET